MKRLLVATLALTTILTACSSKEEPAEDTQTSMEQQKEDNARLIRMWEEAAESETEEVAETEVDNSERHQFEVGPSLAERRESNPFAGASDATNDLSKELSDAVNNAAIQTYEMNDVIIKVMGVERSKFAHGTRIDVEYAVENTVKERRMVPLERTIIVTNDGTQVEFDRDVSNLPEWDLVSDTKTEGTVSFYLKDVEPSEVASVDVIVPGVDFKRSDDELFTVYFNE